LAERDREARLSMSRPMISFIISLFRRKWSGRIARGFALAATERDAEDSR
jgi:hypothetical protein